MGSWNKRLIGNLGRNQKGNAVIYLSDRLGTRGFRKKQYAHYPYHFEPSPRKITSLETLVYTVEKEDLFGARREITPLEFKDHLLFLQKAFGTAGYGNLIVDKYSFSFVDSKDATLKSSLSLEPRLNTDNPDYNPIDDHVKLDTAHIPFMNNQHPMLLKDFLTFFDDKHKGGKTHSLHPESFVVASTSDRSVTVNYALCSYEYLHHQEDTRFNRNKQQPYTWKTSNMIPIFVVATAGIKCYHEINNSLYLYTSSVTHHAPDENIFLYPLYYFFLSATAILLTTNALDLVSEKRRRKEYQHHGIEAEIKQHAHINRQDSNKKFYNLKHSLELQDAFKKQSNIYNSEQFFQKHR